MTLCALSVSAGPWIDVGETRLRNNLELLNDSGAISVSLTTWPLMWSDVKRAFDKIDRAALNSVQMNAFRELKFELTYQTSDDLRRSVEIVGSNSRSLFRDFGSFQREKGELRKSMDWMGDDLAFRLSTNLRSESGGDVGGVDLYGSYLAGVLGGEDGNWLIGIGAVERWWGAGYQSSLILSNNSLPVPGAFLRTKHGQVFETPLLSWLGEWHFVSFLGQMESDRAVPEAKLMGMRFTFMPAEGLEIGLSRAMQWGGVGRSDKLKTFWESLTSSGENEEGQAGNQLAGYDARYGFRFSSTKSAAVYFQSIGEDEAGYLPARRTHLLGGTIKMILEADYFLGYSLEYANTTADAFGSVFPNIVYEHSIYQNGYRYRGRSIGASFDNDAEVVSVAAFLQRPRGALSSVRISYLQLNEDGVARGNTVSQSDASIYALDAYHQCQLFGGKFAFGVRYLSESPKSTYEDIKRFAGVASWQYRY